MILRLSVRDVATSVSHDVEITAEPGSSVASLLAALPVRIAGRTCAVGTTVLDPEATLAESPLVSGVTITVGRVRPDEPAAREGTVGGLRAVAGPDAGLLVWLPPGRHSVGRDPSAAVVLNDLEVSRRHARLDISADGAVSVVDVGSSNGTWIDGERTSPNTPSTLAAGQTLELGDGRFEWLPLGAAALRASRTPDGHLDFDRAFAPAPALDRAEVALPQAETAARNMSALVVTALVPIALGSVMAAVMQQPTMLLIALLGPVTAFVTYFLERRQRRARDRTFAEDKDRAQRRIDTLVTDEQKLRRRLAPDEWELTLVALRATRGLWPRNADSADGLLLRVGTADRPAAIDLRGEPWPGFTPPTLTGVPVTVDLRATGVLGVVGPPAETDALVRWLLVQLGTLRSPDDLRMVLIAATDDDELAWARWLPHVDAGEAGHSPCWIGNTQQTRSDRVDELRELVATRTAQRSSGELRFTEEVVVVLHGALALRHLPGMREVLREGPSVGVYVICVDRHDMNECRGLCDLGGADPLRLTRSRDDHPETAEPDGTGRGTAERIARALAPMRDRLTLAGAQSAMPYPVRLADLVVEDVRTGGGVLDRWGSRPGPQTEVPIGADGSGPVTVDVARQGPHTMLGGATGAGKSILLQTLVTSLLLANRQDELNLILVDFKGGSAFLPFERCPHVVGLIRSTGETPADIFDEAAANRVLASVRAEVRRRESMLARYGGEIDLYWRARRTAPHLPALPRLVMIFDEYARVLEVTPNFLKELVNVAAKGRSLGMHLVLATQSLQGKLSSELKNNISLRITLRQNEPAESVEVLGVPDAAGIPGRLRGRGMILCTTDESRTPQLFQSGYLGDPPPAGGAPPVRVRIVEWPALGVPRPMETVDHGDAATDLDLTIAAVTAASDRLGLPAPFRPLLPPLPAELPLSELSGWVTAEPSAAAVPFGLLDDPAAQAQPAAVLDLAGTDRLLVAGGPQSGRTTVARSLITSVASRLGPDQAHLYVIENRPAGLSAYAVLPHCGAVLSAAEPDRIRRLVTWLDSEVQRRTVARFAATGEPDPWIIVIIDGWEYFENRGDPNFLETSLLGTMRGIITAGPPVGVHVVAIGGQDMMSGKVPGLYSHRILLPFPKEEIRKQSLSGPMVPPAVLPGRAIDAGNGLHLQVCRTSVTPADLAARVRDPYPANRLPRRFPAMPARIALAELDAPAVVPSATWIPIGVGGPDVATLGVDLFDAGPHLMLVSGPGGSGRTTAAATLAHGLRRIDVGVLAITPPRSPLRTLLPEDAGVRVLTGTTLKDADLRVAVEAFGDGPYAIVIDDCEQITVTPTQEGFSEAPTLLQDIAGPGALGRQALIMCGDATPILEGQRRALMRIVNEVMTAGTRVLLTPTSVPVARTHGFTLERDQFFAGPPGRGHLTVGRGGTLVQLATP